MKNYICINGKKTELTKEQLKQLKQLGLEMPVIELTDNGKIAKIGDYEFIVLKSKNAGETRLLLKNSLCDSVFGEDNNDFRQSKVKTILDEFAQKIEALIGSDNLLTHTVDLTADDGLKDYGTIGAKMSLLTADVYRENVYIIDEYKLNKWWWLVTPCSTKTHDWETAVKCVSPSGDIGDCDCYDSVDGVRPFCIVKSCIFVSNN